MFNLPRSLEKRKSRQVFAAATDEPSYLDIHTLETLQMKYPAPPENKYGAHAYSTITVPYCQFLFQKNILNDFAIQNGLNPIDFGHVNGWSIQSYRALWNKYSHALRRIRYHEQVDLSHLNLISKYPSCFKSKSDCFDNFIVKKISVLFQKTDHELPDNEVNPDTQRGIIKT